MNNTQNEKVRAYFHKIAWQFDSIYTGKKSMILRTLDRIFRKDMYQRFEMTLVECQPATDKKILDIGCGSGRFCFPLAKQGAKRVLGLDFAQNMIDLAQRLAQEQDVAGRCEFRCADFLNFPFQEKFDYVMAVGLFDYVKEPGTYLAKIRALTKEKFIATFPRKWTYRRLLRKIRLRLYDCPVYFFSKQQIKKLYQQSGFTNLSIKRIGKIYFVVAKVSEFEREAMQSNSSFPGEVR